MSEGAAKRPEDSTFDGEILEQRLMEIQEEYFEHFLRVQLVYA
jgi:hypothetical protein